MLSGAAEPVVVRPPARRTHVVAALLLPTARVSRLGMAAVTIGLAALPAVVAVARGDDIVTAPIVMVFLVAGANLAWGAEDPAASLLAAMPVPSSRRTILRMTFVGLVTAIGLGLALSVVAWGPGLPADWVDRIAELATAAALAVAVALVAVRQDERAAGPAGVVSGLLGAGLVAALALRWPRVLPSFLSSPTHTRWWLLAAASLAVAALAGRDPGRR